MEETFKQKFYFIGVCIGLITPLIFGFILYKFSIEYIETKAELEMEGLRAGKVQQAVENQPAIWVEPKDYVPYKIGSY